MDDLAFPVLLSASRPVRLNEITLHINSGTSVVSLGWVDSAGVTQWLTLGTTSTVIPNHEIVFGTGASITSSPHLTFDEAGFGLLVKDTNGAPVIAAINAAASRNFLVVDEASQTILGVDATAANRAIKINDAAGTRIVDIGTRVASRSVQIKDSAAALMVDVDTIAATRLIRLGLQAGVNIEIDLVALTLVSSPVAGGSRQTLNLSSGVWSTSAVSPAALSAGNNDNYAGATGSWMRLTGNGGTSAVRGIVAPTTDGAEILLTTIGGGTITYVNQSGIAPVTNNIITMTNADTAIAQEASIRLRYDMVTGRWRQVG